MSEQSGNLMHFFIPIIELLVFFFNMLSVVILVIGVCHVLKFFIMRLYRPVGEENIALSNNAIKNKMGSYVLLSLEVLIAADIIETIIKPTFTDIIMLALIVVIRTVISYFLTKEIKEFEDEKS